MPGQELAAWLGVLSVTSESGFASLCNGMIVVSLCCEVTKACSLLSVNSSPFLFLKTVVLREVGTLRNMGRKAAVAS